ncbi:hypothetical protein BTUL_0348g00060 [Botrytis tulipae]|uniref:Uncharacterized protein n=1 Tax=Botrytis tulipae TaxID=87230 RepID=A0A4Z1E8P9_9HELO|nr:hypothetical protein BTUL_0348g00060 [Botrytis tulipae]
MNSGLNLTSTGAVCCILVAHAIKNAQAWSINLSTVKLAYPITEKITSPMDFIITIFLLMQQNSLEPHFLIGISRNITSENLRNRDNINHLFKIYNENEEFQNVDVFAFLKLWALQSSSLSATRSPSPTIESMMVNIALESVPSSASSPRPSSQPPLLPRSFLQSQHLRQQFLPLPFPPTSGRDPYRPSTHYAEFQISIPQMYTIDDRKDFLHRYQIFFQADHELNMVPPYYHRGLELWFSLDNRRELDGRLGGCGRLIVVVPSAIQVLINIQPMRGFLGTNISLDRCAFLTVCSMEYEKYKDSKKGEILAIIIRDTISSFGQDARELEEQVTSAEFILTKIVAFFNKEVLYTDDKKHSNANATGRLRGIWTSSNGMVLLDIRGGTMAYGFWVNLSDFGMGWEIVDLNTSTSQYERETRHEFE